MSYKSLYIILILAFFVGLLGCSSKIKVEESGSYPSALMWNGAIYNASISNLIDLSTINYEIGVITNEVNPMPIKDGEINDTRYFTMRDKIFSIKDVEQTEAIAVSNGEKYYRLDRIRCSLSIIWDDRVYDFIGNYDNENEINNIGAQLGEIKCSGINYADAENGDITTLGEEVDKAVFQVGGKICLLKNINLDKAIAVEDKNGKYHKAIYVKKHNLK